VSEFLDTDFSSSLETRLRIIPQLPEPTGPIAKFVGEQFKLPSLDPDTQAAAARIDVSELTIDLIQNQEVSVEKPPEAMHQVVVPGVGEFSVPDSIISFGSCNCREKGN